MITIAKNSVNYANMLSKGIIIWITLSPGSQLVL